MPAPQPTGGPTLLTCPDCGGILEPTVPPWQSLVQSLHAEPPRHGAEDPTQWQCLICGYQKRD